MGKVKKILMCTVLAEAFYKSRYELITEFIELGYEVVLLAPESGSYLEKQFDGVDIKYYQINLSRTGLNPLKDLAVISQIQRIISVEQPEVTYAFGGAKAAIYTTIAASKEKVPGNYCMINGLGSIFRGKGLRNRTIRTVMSSLFRYSCSKSTGVLFQNNDDLREFAQAGLLKNESKTIVVNGSGVNLARFAHQPPRTNEVFLFVGRLLRDKGIYEFIHAAKLIKNKYPNIEFWIVGGYDQNPTGVKESEMISWVNSGFVKYFGQQDDVYPFYRDCSVFVLPSYHEGTPRTCLEAMAVGRPVITTNAPGCKETVIDNETGFLVPTEDALELARKMEYFISNPHEISRMGANAVDYVQKKYDVNKVNSSIVNFILK